MLISLLAVLNIIFGLFALGRGGFISIIINLIILLMILRPQGIFGGREISLRGLFQRRRKEIEGSTSLSFISASSSMRSLPASSTSMVCM